MDNNIKHINNQIVTLRKEGLYQREIAEKLNVTIDKVKYVLKVNGIKEIEYKKTCKRCHEGFVTKHRIKKFCCERCRCNYNKKNKGNEYTCRYCGDRYKGYVERNNCTDECRDKEEDVKEAMKRFVEAINPHRQRSCEECGETFYAVRLGKRYCSNQCGYKRKRTRKMYQHKCRECGRCYTDNRKNSAGCGEECKKRYRNRVDEIKRRRVIVSNGRVDWDISVERLSNRDKGVCYLCNTKVDMKDYSTTEEGHFIAGEYYPSIDHVIPISKGGTHSWDNVKLAHRICSTYKSNKVLDNRNKQLTLL